MEVLRVRQIDHSALCSDCNLTKVWSRGLCNTCYRRKSRRGQLEKRLMPVVLAEQQQEILDGLMLGDGCLFKHKPTHKPYLAIQRQQSDRGYLEHHLETFSQFIVQPIVDKMLFDNRTHKTYSFSRMVTRHATAFEPTYLRWYKDGIKQVPNDLVLTPLMIATWFCDDGWIGFSSKSKCAIKLKMSTHGFARDGVIQLATSLNTMYCSGFHVYQDNGASYISAANRPTRLMFEDILQYIPNCMHRKITCLY